MKVAVIGTGTLGPSIAQVFAQCDMIEKVYLCKGRESSKSNGKDKIDQVLNKLVVKEKISSEQANKWLSKIETGNKMLAENADILVEAVAEKLDIKKEIFRELDQICNEHTVFTTNTSSLPINIIGEGLSRPLVGMHFFNPASVMKLVEVVASDGTPHEIVDFVMKMALEIGKTPILVHEAPGFVVNRVLIPMINEAISIYAEGVASVEDIDTAMKLGANHPMGPLALGDLIGLDVVLAILNVMLKESGDNRYLPQPMLKRMVREKRLGRKTGEGFYKY
ncbi:3-hydroxyacyl-CoA dehydrogenase family protein [Oribacterium sp. NK2B42]|uniref:3-hydroxyacyl-CoA dehydrogenase family protein n=1 Tax=Oribacterium sp. NK2B42 TaxID=689781 RepID=UPI0003F6F073|nr:3-hydroxyacyl-CoA dehydrogenase NAD-binding domain-containing protein [Oribacterium sp. NK2B42]